MGILSTNTHLIGVNAGGGTVSGAVRYDIEQDLTLEEQAQARANIGFDGAIPEYSAGANIDITNRVISVTGKKYLEIDDESMSATEKSGSIEIGVREDYIEQVSEGAVDIVINKKIEDGEIITTVFRDSSLSGNGTSGSPLGLASAFKVEHDDTLSGYGTADSPLGLANDYQYTSPSGTSTINNDNHTIEQTNKAIDEVPTKRYTTQASAPHMEIEDAGIHSGINLGAYHGQWYRFQIWTRGLEEGQDAHIIFREYNGVTLGPIPITKETQNYDVIIPSGSDNTLWYGLDKEVNATQICINFMKYVGEGTPVKTVREMAWKDDVDALSAKVSINSDNISANTTDIDTVSAKADNTWTYIQEHEPSWGATLHVGNGITGTGSEERPLGLSALRVASTLSGNGVTSDIGLIDSYALASDLQSTQATVLSNSNSINSLQENYDSLQYTVQTHTELINGLDNEIEECEGKVDTNAENIESLSADISAVSGNMPKIYSISRGGYSLNKNIYFTSQYDNYGDSKKVHIARYTDDGTSVATECGYTVSVSGRKNAETAPNLLNRSVSTGSYNNTTKLHYYYVGPFSSEQFVEGAIILQFVSGHDVSIMPITATGDVAHADWNAGNDTINIHTNLDKETVSIPFCWSNKNIRAIGVKGLTTTNPPSTTEVDVISYYAKGFKG